MSGIANSKEQVIASLVDARRNIIELARNLSSEQQDAVFLGTWSVTDLLAHLAGWDYANVESVKELTEGARPTVLSQWNPDWQAYNAKLVKQYRRDDFSELLALLQASHRALIDLLQSFEGTDFDRDWGVPARGGKSMTIALWLQGEIDDERKHFDQMKAWLRKNKTG